MIQSATHLSRPSRGFTLIELMIALVLGLLMIGATVTVFLSNQQTSRTMTELGNAQEAFRFASHTIMRVVQQGEIQDPKGKLLSVLIKPADGNKDCFGRSVDGPTIDFVRNTFFFNGDELLNGDELQCRVEVFVIDNATPTIDEIATLVEGLDPNRSVFEFGVGNAGFWSNNSDWVAAKDVTEWVNVRTVRVKLAKQAGGDAIGAEAVFSATMRCGALDIC